MAEEIPVEIANLCQQDGNGMTSLHRACRSSDFWAVVNFLDKVDSGFMRARVLTYQDGTGKLPLHHASRNGSPNLISLLLERFNFGSTSTFHPESLVIWRDSMGMTPLHMAARSGNTAGINLLVAANVNKSGYLNMQDDNGNTAWDLACKFKETEAAELLFDLKTFDACRTEIGQKIS